MSIADQLTNLQNCISDIRNAISSKGVVIADSDKITVFAEKINLIEQGSGGSGGGTAYNFNATNTDEHQLLNITLNGMSATLRGNNYTYPSTLSACARLGDTWTAELTATNSGYEAGTLSATSGTVSGNVNIVAGPASIKKYTITIIQSPHQTITVTCDGVAHTSTFMAEYEKAFTVTIVAEDGYTAGSLSKQGGNVFGDTEIRATSAYINSGGDPVITFVSNRDNAVLAISKNWNQVTQLENGQTFTAELGSTYQFSLQNVEHSDTTTITESGGTPFEFSKYGYYEYTITGDITVTVTQK